MENFPATDLPTAPADSMQAFGPLIAVFMGAYFLILAVFAIVAILAMWKIFTKAGKPGWAAIVPIYNAYIMLGIVGRPGWWLLLFFIPLVNMAVSILIALDLARSFGKSDAFGIIGLWLFNLIGMLMLAFGDAKYVGPAVKTAK